jgi:hypothetical protein
MYRNYNLYKYIEVKYWKVFIQNLGAYEERSQRGTKPTRGYKRIEI